MPILELTSSAKGVNYGMVAPWSNLTQSISFTIYRKQDILALTLRGNTDHGPHPYHTGENLAGGKGYNQLVRVPPPSPTLTRPNQERNRIPYSKIRPLVRIIPPRQGHNNMYLTSTLPTHRITDTCENITFLRITYVVGNKYQSDLRR